MNVKNAGYLRNIVQQKILHPFLLAIYPVLALVGNNIEEVKMEVALRALVISPFVAACLFLLLRGAIKNATKAALITSLIIIFFLSYGHIYELLSTINLWGVPLGRHRLLAIIWLALFGFFVWWIASRKSSLQPITQVINLVSIILLVYPILQIGIYSIRSLAAQKESFVEATSNNLRLPADSPTPDIYYIILDAYARDDTLQEYGIDNQSFLNELQELGFDIARCSQSNYAQTRLSLASSLNLYYLQDWRSEVQPDNTSRVWLAEAIQHNTVRQTFESLGYKSVAFETGFKSTQWEDADIYFSPNGAASIQQQFFGGLNPFEEMFIRTSAGLLVLDGGSMLPQLKIDNPRRIHRDRILYTLDQLRQLPETPGPKFVFAHLVIPHPPYVFGPNGEFIDIDKPANLGYPDQISFLNRQMISLLEALIQNSSTPPIIVIQADHGAIHVPPDQRLNILNAYYLPGKDTSAQPEDISPVNTFRMIFNYYFGGNYEILDNVSYFSSYQRPYDFVIVPNQRPGCPGQ